MPGRDREYLIELHNHYYLLYGIALPRHKIPRKSLIGFSNLTTSLFISFTSADSSVNTTVAYGKFFFRTDA